MKFAKEPVEGSEKRCVCGAFGSTRVSHESNCRESVLPTPQFYRLRCSDSDVTAAVLADLPMDSTSIEDVLHASLLTKEAAKVARAANDMDLWLAAHITDLMLPLGLPESSVLSCVFYPHFEAMDIYMLIPCITGVSDGTSL